MRICLPISTLLVLPAMAIAGMPSPLPIDASRTTRLTDSALFRFQTISFFLLVFFLAALAAQMLWNGLRKDFPSLPRISYPRAVGAVFLWGVLFVIVLTMISGARELMTPGAWKKQGATYKLDVDSAPQREHDAEAIRRGHLEKLRTALWQFAATHGGRFPRADEVSAIPRDLWEVPDAGGLQYRYVPGRSAGHLPEVIVVEPEIESDRRFVLDAAGDIRVLTSAELKALSLPGGQP
ncbi:MAG TPA: hypothetical protein VHR66_19775 [Gemmataceae bacterium]|jgi:hypothetical protein|nr:hypothetical protein [Gemmataceae bacterium]